MHKLIALLTASTALAVPPDLITCGRALDMGGEKMPAGQSSVSIVPAPDAPPGTHSLRLSFRLDKHQDNQWLDVSSAPAPPLDLSGSHLQRLWLRTEQPIKWLRLKVCDADNPGANHAAFEDLLLVDGKPPPPGRWLPLDIKLPADALRRNAIDYLGFYLPCADKQIPLGREFVMYVGKFPLEIPPRPPWPPVATPLADTAPPLLTPPFVEGAPWLAVRGKDKQTEHVARFVDGTVEFDSDTPGWNEYLWSDPDTLQLKALTQYRLQFDYEILRSATGGTAATFYSLVRAEGTIQEDVGWQRWAPAAGVGGTHTITFTTHDRPGYRLIFGIRHCGAIRLSNLYVYELSAAAGGAE